MLVALAACQQPPTTLAIEGQTMGTTYHVVVVGADRDLTEDDLRREVEEVFHQVNLTFSNWDPNSEVSLFNADRSGEPVPASGEMLDLLALADEVHEATGGKFDLTMGPLIELWGFGALGPDQDIPSVEAINGALEKIGQTRLIQRNTDDSTLQKTDVEAEIYVASIAKGRGIDSAAERLIDLGLDDFMVEIGGDLFAVGTGPTGQGWRVGIEEPTTGSRKVERIVAINRWGMATSGDYRNYFEEAGVRYSHILNPETGRPVTHTTASVTILTENAAEADAWATALLVVGSEDGLAIAEEHGLAAYFIDRAPPGSDEPFVSTQTSFFTNLAEGS